MGLNAGKAMFMKWYEFEDEFYSEYPVMRAIIDGGAGFSIVRLIGSLKDETDGQFERQGTYGNLKFRHAGAKDIKSDGPKRHWAVKPRGQNSMKILVDGYVIERRDDGARSYNVYIYPPGYTKNSGGEPWIGAYMTGVDDYAAEKAIFFARDLIRKASGDQIVASAIKKRESSKRVMDMIRKNPALAAKFESVDSNLDEVIDEVNDDETERDILKEESQTFKEMTIEELKKEIDQLESQLNKMEVQDDDKNG